MADLFQDILIKLQKDFRRVPRMRGALPDESSVLVLMGRTAMDKESYHRVIPRIREDKTLFPYEEPTKGEQTSRNGVALLAELIK